MLELDLVEMRAVSGGVIAIGGSSGMRKEKRIILTDEGEEIEIEIDAMDSGGGDNGNERPLDSDPDWLDKLKEILSRETKNTTTEPEVKPAVQVIVITGQKMTDEEKKQDVVNEAVQQELEKFKIPGCFDPIGLPGLDGRPDWTKSMGKD